jgi:gamma-glutamylcyclotransferase (GGCT)/AIG2-like uncharacterized protein YtfP
MAKFLNAHSEFVGKGYFHGKLFLVDTFPGAIKSVKSTDRVFGTLLKIPDFKNTIKILDTYEGYDENQLKLSLFIRELVTIYLSNDQKIQAWVYLYNRPVVNLKLISDFDFH